MVLLKGGFEYGDSAVRKSKGATQTTEANNTYAGTAEACRMECGGYFRISPREPGLPRGRRPSVADKGIPLRCVAPLRRTQTTAGCPV